MGKREGMGFRVSNIETVKLTAKFKLKGVGVIDELFETYKAIVNELLSYAHSRGITSFKRLRAEKYRELRKSILVSRRTTSTQHARWLARYTSLSGS